MTKPRMFASAELELVQTRAQEDRGTSLNRPLMAVYHHERLDVTGYAPVFSKDSLSFEDCILLVYDATEAMGPFGPYRRTASAEQVADEVQQGIITRYDPGVAD